MMLSVYGITGFLEIAFFNFSVWEGLKSHAKPPKQEPSFFFTEDVAFSLPVIQRADFNTKLPSNWKTLETMRINIAFVRVFKKFLVTFTEIPPLIDFAIVIL